MKHAREDYQRIQDPAGLIPKEEPVFLLRGQDKAAPITVMIWAELNRVLLGDDRLSKLAMDQAMAMRDWQEKVKSKAADLPEILDEQGSKNTKLAERLVKLGFVMQTSVQGVAHYHCLGALSYTAERIVVNDHLAYELKARCLGLGFAIKEEIQEAEDPENVFVCMLERADDEGVIRAVDTSIGAAPDYNFAAILACTEALENGNYVWLSSPGKFVKRKSKKK